MAAGARGKGRPKLIEAAEIDRAIRDAALRLLLEHGEAATMHAVALAAGISRKSLYARYPNKGELVLAVIGELLQGAGGLEYDRSGSVEDRLRHYIEAALATIALPQSKALQQLVTQDSAYLAALRSDMLDATRRIFFEPLRALLGEAQDSGELVVEEIDAATRVVVRMIFAASLSTEQGWLTSPEPEDYPAFLTRMIMRGLLPR
jgi:TetR/AcrR family transcriptional regulator, mexJK operon transcriptional repressor